MNVNLNDFEVVVIEQVGDTSITTCFKSYYQWKAWKTSDWLEPPTDNSKNEVRLRQEYFTTQPPIDKPY